VKERTKSPDRTLLLAPSALLLFVLAMWLVVLVNALMPLWEPGQAPVASLGDVPEDARAFVFFRQADINTIDIEGLILIPGIGQNSAQKILDYRDAYGFILDVDELFEPQGPLGLRKKPVVHAFLRALDDF